MTDKELNEKLLEEIRAEQQISPFVDNSEIENYVKEGMYFINNICSVEIDFSEDLNARSLLKNYVMYANHKQLAQFKEVFQSEYIELQIRYYTNSDVS